MLFRLPSSVFRFTALFLIPGSVPTAVPPCGTGRAATLATGFLREINALRAKRQLEPLRLNAALCAMGRERARELTEAGEEEFDLLPEDELFERAQKAGYRASYLSELVVESEGDVGFVVSTWPSNVRTMALRPALRDLGVGVGRLGGSPLYAFFLGLSQQEDFARRTARLADREGLLGEMLDRLNRERRNARLRPLRLDPVLSKVAQRHADDMLARSFYGHETPEGGTPFERVRMAGYVPASVAENVARGQLSVDEVMDGWMESDVHRVNILGRSYSHVGFGLAYGINAMGPTVLWVQVFAAPAAD